MHRFILYMRKALRGIDGIAANIYYIEVLFTFSFPPSIYVAI